MAIEQNGRRLPGFELFVPPPPIAVSVLLRIRPSAASALFTLPRRIELIDRPLPAKPGYWHGPVLENRSQVASCLSSGWARVCPKRVATTTHGHVNSILRIQGLSAAYAATLSSSDRKIHELCVSTSESSRSLAALHCAACPCVERCQVKNIYLVRNKKKKNVKLCVVTFLAR